MTQKFLPLLLMLVSLSLGAQNAKNMKLYAHWNDTAVAGITAWNDLSGWQNPATGKEYIITGNMAKIYFFEIGPDTLYKCDAEWPFNFTLHRDYEVYDHYAYCVSDAFGDGRLQIFDLNYLPDSAVLVHMSDSFFRTAHTIFIDSASKRLYAMGSRHSVPDSNAALIILSLEDPVHPTVLARIKEPLAPACPYIHEAFARNDTVYCSCAEKGFFILDAVNPSAPQLISSVTPPYPFNGYNHSGCVDPTGQYLIFTDEVPSGLPIKLYDISTIGTPDYISTFDNKTHSTPHNTYWIGDLLYVSYYLDGVVVFDMKDPLHPEVRAFYDTYPQTPSHPDNLDGCWGVFPYFKSGKIAASDMQNGIFVFELDTPPNTGLASVNQFEHTHIYPNPFQSSISIQHLPKGTKSIQLMTINGAIVAELKVSSSVDSIELSDVDHLPEGMYILSITGTTGNLHRKMMKVK